MSDFLTWLEGKKTYLSAAGTFIGVVVLLLLRNAPPAFGLDPWISESIYEFLLTLIMTGGAVSTFAAMRSGVKSEQAKIEKSSHKTQPPKHDSKKHD